MLKDDIGEVGYVPIDRIHEHKVQNARVTKKNEVIALSGEEILSLDIKYFSISRRNTTTGKPQQIYTIQFAKLQNKQERLVEACNRVGRSKLIFINKRKVKIKIRMIDLAAMTAMTGVEYQLFERPDKYILVMGDSVGINISERDMLGIINGRYKWVGHTHPGDQANCLTPQDQDFDVLDMLRQGSSSIYNQIGSFYVFGEKSGGIMK